MFLNNETDYAIRIISCLAESGERVDAAGIAEKTGVKVFYIDERLTSAEAEEILISSGVRREKRKELIDKISAQIILQTHIESHKRG